MEEPNIFNYATNELSQDAIICYILEWGKSKNKKIDENLHNLAIEFLNSIFNKFEKIDKPNNYQKIEIKKQYNKIDVLCVINDEYPIIIEDKKDSKNHSNQLNRYLESIKKNFDETKIMPVYFKTGDQSNYTEIKNAGYQVYSRKDFLSVLMKNNIKNNIVKDYTNYLKNIENEVNSYETLPITQWNGNSWKGFFMALNKELKNGDWSYVPNPSGGFLSFSWFFKKRDNCQTYLQLEQNKLCFKIYVNDKNNKKECSDCRNKWYMSVINKAKDQGLDLIKPKRFGTGKSMTVCLFNGDYREEKDGTINFKKTFSRLKKAEDLLQSLK